MTQVKQEVKEVIQKVEDFDYNNVVSYLQPYATSVVAFFTNETVLYTLSGIAVVILALYIYFQGPACKVRKDLSGKWALITGSSAGIGKMTALELAHMNCNIIFACRDEKKTLAVIEWIRSQIGNKTCKLVFISLEMSDMTSVETLCDRLKQAKLTKFDYLVNNAGLAATRRKTKQLNNVTFGVNHVAHYKLTKDILERKYLNPQGRIVNVSSILGETADLIQYDKYGKFQEPKDNGMLYAQSKLANTMHAMGLATRFTNESKFSYYNKAIAVSLHPGAVRSEIWAKMVSKASFMVRLQHNITFTLAAPFLFIGFKSEWRGAQTTLHCILSDDIQSGKYYADCAEKPANKKITEKDINNLFINSEKMTKFNPQEIIDRDYDVYKAYGDLNAKKSDKKSNPSPLSKTVIVSSKRTPFSRTGTMFLHMPVDDLILKSVDPLIKDLKLENKKVGQVMVGCCTTHIDAHGLARDVVARTQLNQDSPAFLVRGGCVSSLEAVSVIANKIALGQIESGIACGGESISDVPLEFNKNFQQFALKFFYLRERRNGLLMNLVTKYIIPIIGTGLLINLYGPWWSNFVYFLITLLFLAYSFSSMIYFASAQEKATKKSMGESCEDMAKEWKIERKHQDEMAYLSHMKACKSIEEGYYKDFLVENLKDNIPRADTTIERLGKLKTCFDKKENGATMTAGNSTANSDGSASVFLCSEEYALRNGYTPLATVNFIQTSAINVREEGLLMGPVYAIPKMLKEAGLTLQDFDRYEIHEAFSAQLLCTLKALDDEKYCKEKLGLDKKLGRIDLKKLNVHGGSVAIGHPFGATGARLVGQLAKDLSSIKGGRGLISVCASGGNGMTLILESYNQ